MKLLQALLAVGLLCSLPATAYHCDPKPSDWNDARTVELSLSLPGNLFVARCRGERIDFEEPYCMEVGNMFDGVPCPKSVLDLAAILRAERAAQAR